MSQMRQDDSAATIGIIPFPDRTQRVVFGLGLMLLTILGLFESSDWKKWAALVLQSELLLTGLAGWCPIYWACRIGNAPAGHRKRDHSAEIDQ